MYLLKVKGKAKIPDFIQIRDDEFTLIAYYRFDHLEESILKADFSPEIKSKILYMSKNCAFGIIEKI